MDRRRWRCGSWDREKYDLHSRSCACGSSSIRPLRAMGFAQSSLFERGFKASVITTEQDSTERQTVSIGTNYETVGEAEKAVDDFLARFGKDRCPGLSTVAKTPEEAECRKQLRARIRGSILADVQRRYADWRKHRVRVEETARQGGWDPDVVDRAAREPCITASDLVHTEDMDQIEEEFGVTGRNCMRYNERRMLVWTEAEALRKAGKLKSATGRGSRGREARCYEPVEESSLGRRR